MPAPNFQILGAKILATSLAMCLGFTKVVYSEKRPVASLGERAAPGYTTLTKVEIFLADEFTRTLDNRLVGKAERLRMMTVVCMM